jgi:metallo-beta-lactamase family protein
LPLYTEKDAYTALQLIEPLPNHGGPVRVAPGIEATFRIAGHILGSSLVLLDVERAGRTADSLRILFSGDLGHYDQPIIRDPQPPTPCDYLLVESTYGDRLHDPEDPKVALERIIDDAIRRDAPILIPAFAVGRTQELLYLIRELEDENRIAVLPVCVDSPMAAAATTVYSQRKEEHDEDYATVLKTKHPLRPHRLLTCSSKEESKRLNEAKGARVIISASGMMTGGRVLHHALRMLPDPEATIVFVGFQAEGTPGRRVLDGEDEVKILGQWVPRRCRVERIGGFSAHADWKEVLRWLEGLQGAPKLVFTTHGEPKAAAAMAERIRERFGWPVEVPTYGLRVELE